MQPSRAEWAGRASLISAIAAWLTAGLTIGRLPRMNAASLVLLVASVLVTIIGGTISALSGRSKSGDLALLLVVLLLPALMCFFCLLIPQMGSGWLD